MRVIIRATVAIAAILVAAHFLNYHENLSTIENYKYELVQSQPVQEILNSGPVQKVQNFDFEEFLPSDFF
ncbi:MULTISPECIES: hypothetical protein [Staphylococcus]|uniref:Uncharacterized protein n=1 Tax=Staphylococcus schleiferi TaxID=1295 RepID=A0A7Z7QMY0_STASC|nr:MULTISPECIES: hypothetical protein [Staphylococcus]QGS46241.1 hypothetical protein FOB90_05865 [Mammaliicoccus fleurettii]EPD49135.1 hypothetical protein HMPREF1208_01912 [Staphylococcus sp. HGB0015]MBF1993448.1 hypothetical protein [Staphylococcus schleiferi]MBF2038960.1 hypothetical protein [Staphylococcus schleiferi]MBF2101031.1 hypothetical protein [Staphylococcus schleiferi]